MEGIDIKEAQIDVLLRGIFGYIDGEQKPRKIARKCVEEGNISYYNYYRYKNYPIIIK